jgi:hypothetical protein
MLLKTIKITGGIFILENIAAQDEAGEVQQTDPAIKAGLLDIELYNCYGSTALPEYLPYPGKIWNVKPRIDLVLCLIVTSCNAWQADPAPSIKGPDRFYLTKPQRYISQNTNA